MAAPWVRFESLAGAVFSPDRWLSDLLICVMNVCHTTAGELGWNERQAMQALLLAVRLRGIPDETCTYSPRGVKALAGILHRWLEFHCDGYQYDPAIGDPVHLSDDVIRGFVEFLDHCRSEGFVVRRLDEVAH